MSGPKDTMGVEIQVGNTVLLASTSNSSGISWQRVVVSRVSEHRFWFVGKKAPWQTKVLERIGMPHNCLVIDKLLPTEKAGALNTWELMQDG